MITILNSVYCYNRFVSWSTTVFTLKLLSFSALYHFRKVFTSLYTINVSNYRKLPQVTRIQYSCCCEYKYHFGSSTLRLTHLKEILMGKPNCGDGEQETKSRQCHLLLQITLLTKNSLLRSAHTRWPHLAFSFLKNDRLNQLNNNFQLLKT